MSRTDVSALLNALELGKFQFNDVLSYIDDHYVYTPVSFKNGEVNNDAGQNQGSAKVFAFAKIHSLNQVDTLKLFAEHYQSVQATPDGTDHANIRNFMYYGWQGFDMPNLALAPRTDGQ